MDKEKVLEKIGELWKQCELDPTEVLAIIEEAMDCTQCPARKFCENEEMGVGCRDALLKYLGYDEDPVEFTVF